MKWRFMKSTRFKTSVERVSYSCTPWAYGSVQVHMGPYRSEQVCMGPNRSVQVCVGPADHDWKTLICFLSLAMPAAPCSFISPQHSSLAARLCGFKRVSDTVAVTLCSVLERGHIPRVRVSLFVVSEHMVNTLSFVSYLACPRHCKGKRFSSWAPWLYHLREVSSRPAYQQSKQDVPS